MTIANRGGTWYSTEVVLEDTLGYGDYIFTTRGPPGPAGFPARCSVCSSGSIGPCWDDAYLWWNPDNEFDIEFSRWGNPADDMAQFVAQPCDWSGNMSRFDMMFAEDEITSHAFRWLPDRVECSSWRGGLHDETPENIIHSWTYTGPHVPRPEQPRVHVNLWQFDGPPAVHQEVVLEDFHFVPAGAVAPVPGTGRASLPRFQPAARLLAATPNPFNPSTTLRYVLDRGSATHLAVYDLAGRKVRVLVDGFQPAGDHAVTWDGRNQSGSSVASGIYLYILQACDVVETRRMTMLK